MPDKQQLHQLVDQLPDAELSAAARYLQFLLCDASTRLRIPYPASFLRLSEPDGDDRCTACVRCNGQAKQMRILVV